ncbi:MAG: fumarylacetoacetate hydrolase family protein [Thermoplasmatota archaeon]
MKLATMRVAEPKDAWEQRDGKLVVVDDNAGRVAVVPDDVARSMFEAIQEWDAIEPQLRSIDAQLKNGSWPEDQTLGMAGIDWMAPLPRSTCWIDGSAYVQHIVLVRKARGAEPPEDLREVPLMYQGAADPMLGPHEPIEVESEDFGIDLEAEVGVILGDVPKACKAADAEQHIKLLVAMNDVSLRNLIPRELKAGFGFFHGKPPSHFAPFAVTPDEIGEAWKDGRVHLKMESWRNGNFHGDPDAGPEMYFGFHELIEHAAKTRPLPAGTVLGSGTVSNEDTSRGASCIAEVRMLETIEKGAPETPFLRFGETVKIDVRQDGKSVFGPIEQTVQPYKP